MDVEKARTRKGLLITGVILVVIGLVWVGQGANFIGGSFMTGQTTWLVIGAVFAGVGLVLIVMSRGKARRPPR